MADTPQLSGRDLARQALAAYKATARTAPTNTPAKTRRKKTLRAGSGRDPITFGAAIAGLTGDLPLEAGLAGGDIINQWPTLCPQYAGRVQPVSYDERTGRLDLRPGSHSYAGQLRLLGGQLAKQINDKLGRPVVRTIRVLPVGNIAPAGPAEPIAQQPQPETPVRTRADGCPGYQDALAVVLEHQPERKAVDPYVEHAMRRQEAALRAGRPPETEHRDAIWAQDDAERKAGPAPGSMAASEAAARAVARQNRAARAPRRAFDV